MLREHCRSAKLDWLCIVEPKVTYSSIRESFWHSMGLIFVSKNMRDNGIPNLWVFRSSKISSVSVVFCSDQIILLDRVFDFSQFLLGFVYAHVVHTRRRPLWDYIHYLPSNPKLIVRDFNSILGAHERLSSSPLQRAACIEFQAMIDDCNLLDIPTTGSLFIWTNRRSLYRQVESRIDRALGDQSS